MVASKESKEMDAPKKYLIPDAVVYKSYEMSFKEKTLYFLLAFFVGVFVGYIFYTNWIVGIIAGIFTGYVYVPIKKKQIIAKQIKTLKMQFRDLLETISTSIGAGQNVYDAFNGAYVDLSEQYPENSYIIKELSGILHGMNNNINIEDLLLDLADRSGVEDIMDFANVFDTCYRKGGNLKQVIKSTYQIINDKMEIEMEIETMITSSKTELNIMLVMPVVFAFILHSMRNGLVASGSVVTIASTTVSILLFAIAYFVGKKIMAIKL